MAMLAVASVPAIASMRHADIALLTATLFGAMLGVGVGLGQVIVLSRQVCGRRRWWLANIVGRSLGWLSAVLVGQLLTTSQLVNPLDSNLGPSVLALLLCGCIGGLVYGGVTAWALPTLMPRSQPSRFS